jgi:hypothetical protein
MLRCFSLSNKEPPTVQGFMISNFTVSVHEFRCAAKVSLLAAVIERSRKSRCLRRVSNLHGLAAGSD